MVLITHYMEEVIRADHVYVMDGGRLVMQGTPLMTPPVDLGPYDWDYVDVLGLVTDYQNRPGAIG